MYLRIIIFFIFFSFQCQNLWSKNIKICEWNNTNGLPCITISKTPNSSIVSEVGVKKIIINKKDIINSGAVDTNDILELIPGLDVFQSGQKGQSTSIFTRGSESNHTLVLLNGIAINDQSVTDGLHDFGQDFIQTIQQIEIYKGPNGAHFGPSAIAGAINFITDIDYNNSFSVSGFNEKNNSLNGNFTKITDNGWHLNIKASSNQNETDSAIAKGNENDGSNNYQINLNGIKWLKDDLKFKSTLYSRKTKSDYDGSATDETGYVSDNRMYSLQSGLEKLGKKSDTDIKLHYHNYNRQYENDGYLDEYYSESFVVRGEKKYKTYKNFSYGFGSEYKYDWGNFENRGNYNASTRGHMKDLGLFGNLGYKFNSNQILSFYLRSDYHNTTGRNETYKLNFIQKLNKFILSTTHSSGLRNPTLYELYGTDNYGITGNVNLKPEKSKTSELSLDYNISEKITFNTTAYKSKIFDQIESNSAYTKHENEKIAILQEGLENNLSLNNNNQSLSIFSNFSKSRKINGQAQSRRPDLTYGTKYKKTINQSLIGKFNFNLNYKYTGKYIDYDGSKNSRQKSTDILNLYFSKDIYGNIFSLKISNALNERYEKPATYTQDGRKIIFGYSSVF